MDQRLDLRGDARRGARTRKAKRDAINAKNLAKFGGPIQALYSQRSEYDSLCCFPPPYAMDIYKPDSRKALTVTCSPKENKTYRKECIPNMQSGNIHLNLTRPVAFTPQPPVHVVTK